MKSSRGKKTSPLWDGLIICTIAMVMVWLMVASGRLLAQDELGLFFTQPGRWLHDTSFAWREMGGTGVVNYTGRVVVPFQLAMAALKSVGFSDVLRQAMVLFILLSVSGMSMYALASSLVQDELRRRAGLFAGIVYMLTPYTGMYVWAAFVSHIFVFPFLPLVVYLYVKGLQKKENMWKSAIYVNLAALLPLAAFTNPVYLSPFVLVLVVFFVLHMVRALRCKPERSHIMKFTLIVVFLGMALNTWWIVPLIATASSFYDGSMMGGPLEVLRILSRTRLTVSYIVRGFSSDLVFAYPSFASVTTFLIPGLAFGSLLFKRRSQYVFAMFSIGLLGILICSGIGPPFGKAVETLYVALPYSEAFRNPYNKLGVLLAFSYACLTGFTLSSVSHKLRAEWSLRRRIVSWILPVCVLALAVSPVFLSIYKGTPLEGGQVEIPAYYENADEWLSNQKELFRVMVLPLAPSDLVVYTWPYGYHGTDYPWSKPAIATAWHGPQHGEMLKRLQESLISNSLWKLLAMLNCKYVLVNRDSEYDVPQIPYVSDPDLYISYLSAGVKPDHDNTLQLETGVTLWKPTGTPAHTITSEGRDAAIQVVTYMEEAGCWEGGVAYTPEDPLDGSEYDLLNVTLRVEALEYIARAYVQITDTDGSFKKWEITDSLSSASWAHISVLLESPSTWEAGNETNFSAIKSISVSVEKKAGRMEPTIWWIDEVKMVALQQDSAQYIHGSRAYESLLFFEVEEECFLPRVYTTSQYACTEDLDSMMYMLTKEVFDPRDEVVFVLSKEMEDGARFLDEPRSDEGSNPSIAFQRSNPTEYEVKVSSAAQPFFLVLSESYHSGWKAYAEDGVAELSKMIATYDRAGIEESRHGMSFSSAGLALLFAKPLADEDHFRANGYANGWYINPKEIDKDGDGAFTIMLYFEPQSLSCLGLLMSILTFFSCIGYLCCHYRRRAKCEE